MDAKHPKHIVKKFEAFGFNAILIDGHDIAQIVQAIEQAKNFKNNKPTAVIAQTVKGYGLDSIQGKMGFHGKAFNKDELKEFLKELYAKFENEAGYSQEYSWKTSIPEYKIEQISKQNIKLDEPNFELGQQIATRKAYGIALTSLGQVCHNLLALDAEVKNSTFSEMLEKKYPEKFIECFIAEQNMVSMAVGLTSRGKITFSSTFASFLTRAFDQLRMAAIGHAALRIVGSHAGVSIGQDGPSQMGLEDIALFCSLPGSIVLYPSDGVSSYKLVEVMANYSDGISYLRTTRAETPVLYNNDEQFEIGKCKVLKESDKDQCCVIAAGVTLHEALKAYEILKKDNIFVSVIDLYCVKPLDVETIIKIANKSGKKIVTVEDHYIQGGIGYNISYAIRNSGIRLECLAVEKLPCSGKPEQLLQFEGIDAEAIVEKVKKMVN